MAAWNFSRPWRPWRPWVAGDRAATTTSADTTTTTTTGCGWVAAAQVAG